ncbi:MAG: hypothetical protein K2N16_08870 [Muribaculaceae bacterium]|nr:hypothetical protein [Muribaculaceae bacterium]
METVNNTLPNTFTRNYFLTAGETDAEGKMSMSLIIERVIEVATEHANALGIGYAKLIKRNVGWVLTRLSIKVDEYPGINEEYSVTTWIEGFNRLYSDRCFTIRDASGRAIAHIRSMWVAIDMAKRTAADLTPYIDSVPICPPTCPIPKLGKMPPLGEGAESTPYTFKFSDIDFNRHVNTVMYVRHILNLWPLSYFDAYQIAELDIAFRQECYCEETVDIRLEQSGLVAHAEIVRDGRRAIACSLLFAPRQ